MLTTDSLESESQKLVSDLWLAIIAKNYQTYSNKYNNSNKSYEEFFLSFLLFHHRNNYTTQVSDLDFEVEFIA